MASIVLGAAGAAVGSNLLGPVGRVLGSRLGSLVGGLVDESAFGRSKTRTQTVPLLSDMAVQTSAYGKMIPIVYGTLRIAGNLIWAQPIQQTTTTTTTRVGKGGGGRTVTSSTSSYTVSLAVAICEGPVDTILRVWGDATALDLAQYNVRFYLGGEDQAADALMLGIDGADTTPAYRGLAYAVFEDFPLAAFGNRIPNFTFEVKKRAAHADYGDDAVEDMVQGITLIPGAGEFVYDTQAENKIPGEDVGGNWVQNGTQVSLNANTGSGAADVLRALDQLQQTCPNVGWVSVVAAWYGNSLDAGTCTILPGVEYQTGATTSPATWRVGSFTRGTARQITLVSGSPRFGGTPDDASLLRLIAELKDRGYSVMFYPMLFIDVDGKPWRGHLTGSSADVANFFTKTNGYNAFITHYANLVAGEVDAFVIGSELKGLTSVSSAPGVYPAVNALVSLAGSVKSIVGSAKVTYAADWSEYHHADGGWYNLDPLWASSAIDVIGIDAYFPLTADAQDTTYALQPVIDAWEEGEGWDYYYTDPARTTTAALTPQYAWKNIAWFWNNYHVNPDATTTAWVPNSKKIWFTEYGFPSVDCATNQPNIFYDPLSSDSGFPYFSRGRVDFRAQRQGIAAALAKWSGSSMVERMFLWTWDARPYPYFPDLTSVWADGANWPYGHWVQGKLGVSLLAGIVRDLARRAGLQDSDIDVSAITDPVLGYAITSQQTIRAVVERLSLAYFFDTVESGGNLTFVPRGGASVATIGEDELVPGGNNDGAENVLTLGRQQELELPQRMNVVYLNPLSSYQPATQYAQRQITSSREVDTLTLPLVLDDQTAKVIAERTLYSSWVARNAYAFRVGMKYARLNPADVVNVTANGATHTMRITSVALGRPGILEIEALAEEVSAYDYYTTPALTPGGGLQQEPLSPTNCLLLDIPALPGDDASQGVLRVAAGGLSSRWPGAVLYRSDDGGQVYNAQANISTAAVMGAATTVLGAGATDVFDLTFSVTVVLQGEGELASASQLAVLNGANAALLGDEIIQFTTATLVSPGKYTLSGLLRGRQGTEWAVAAHAAGERFVLLNALVPVLVVSPGLLGLPRIYKPVTVGGTLGGTAEQNFTYNGVALKPYAPVQLAGARDGSGNLTISWVRRARATGEWLNDVDVPLNEASEAYEVEIMNGANVARTITGLTTPSATYSAAQQTTDFGSVQASVSVRIYQLSALVGRGYGAAASV